MIYDLTIMLIGWLYPAFATYNSLNGSLRSQVNWMKYWIVFGVFNAFHTVTGCLEPWVPFLSGFKLFILCWLLPNVGSGSQFIHDDLLDPLLKSNKASISQTVESISNMSGALLRELVKMIYHLLVDVVEQCWLMTRNANDIHVTPRLQSAINEVIAELRAARQAAIFMPHPPQQAIAGQLEERSGDDQDPKSQMAPVVAPAAADRCAATPHVAENEKAEDKMQEKEELEEKPVPAMPAGGVFPTATSSHMTDDTTSLSIFMAEMLNAERMQLIRQLSKQEHLVPIYSSNRLPNAGESEPRPQHSLASRRGKRKLTVGNTRQQQLDLEADLAYSEYCCQQEDR